MLNGDGKVVVPAEYNALTRVRNGLIVALKGAKKEYWEGGEHYSWKGGTTMLIDTKNNVLINNFKHDRNLNFYSLVISRQPNPDTIRQNFKTMDGRYYSFIDYNKEFNNWLKTSLLNDLTEESLLKSAFNEITTWKASAGWTAESKTVFIQRNFDVLRTRLLELNSSKTKYTITDEDLNPFIYESASYSKFYNNCGEAESWIYPVMNIIISHGDKKESTQDSFEFLRTNDGYKFLQVTLANEQIK